MENLTEEIRKKQPFRTIIKGILKILEVKPLSEGEFRALSGETFKVTSSSGKNYKLRYCKGLLKAREIEKNVRRLPEAFPFFYGREGRFLLFEWLEGSAITKDLSPELCFKVGELFGKAHALSIDVEKKEDELFKLIIKNLTLRSVFDSDTLAKMELKYRELKSKVKVEFAMEFTDLHPGNMMKSGNNIFLIDEEGFGHKIKGLGLGKPLLRGFLKDKKQSEAFWEGYKRFSDPSFFTSDYRNFVIFIQLMKYIHNKSRRKENYQKERDQLKEMFGV